MSIPALLQAANDPDLKRHRSTLAVYLHLIGVLDVGEFRRLWHGKVARSLRMHPNTVGDALRTLRERGYLERGPKLMDVYTYRLLNSRRVDSQLHRKQ